jgi:hypothetical protein
VFWGSSANLCRRRTVTQAHRPEVRAPRPTAFHRGRSGARPAASHPEFANPTLIVTINEIAGRFYDRSDFEHALPMFETARAVARQLQDRPGAANSQHDIGSRFGGGHAHRARGRESAVRFGGMAQ